ncbi:MAG TPA: fumarylacetoacetate hydrolase family protein [Burkholderiaceae bacterium]|nr:fumarylacetoacetate hydrolase family protein [Burkholderiaceae bacterium]
MKLATYKDGSRDGQLVLVARDLATAHMVHGVASRMQQLLDDWNFLSPQLQDLYEALNAGRARHAFPFEPASCMAPLPRACQRVEDGPGLRQASGDNLLGPCDEIAWPGEDRGLEVQTRLAVITGEVPRGSSVEQALEGVRLLMLAHSVRLRQPPSPGQDPDDGLALCQPAAAFSPVAVTLDELGPAWRSGRVHLGLQCTRDGRRHDAPDAQGMGRSFGQLIARLCSTRPVRAGSIVAGGPLGADTAPSSPLRPGSVLRSEMLGPDGNSVFGALDQRLAPA